MSLKDWMKKVETAQLNEFATNGQIQIKPASQMPKPPGQQQQAINGQQPQQGQTNANTQVITQGDKTLGTVNNPQLAQQIKQSIGKGEMSLAGGELQEDDTPSMGAAPTQRSVAFEEILGNHPHEHKMCQEGWGMHEGLYEALRDHYFREGRIPRELMHGDRESLRSHVEECYAEDTGMKGNQAAINNGMLDEEDFNEGSIEDFTMNARQADPRIDRYATDPKPSKLGAMADKFGSAVKTIGNKVMDKLHPSDEKLRSGPLDEEMSPLERSLRRATKENTMYESKNTKSVREATEKTKTGLKHKADAGGYGRKDDEEDTDEDGKKIKKVTKDEPKKGRGRPKKTDNASGEDKKFDFSALSKTSGSKAPKDAKKGKVIKGKAQSHADNKKEKELDESRYNAQHQEFFAKNPGHGQGKEAVTVGGRIATKVTPTKKPAPVTKNKMTPFSSEVKETLKGGQRKLDINKNGKLDGGDFAMLRGKKKKVAESAEFALWDQQLKSKLSEDMSVGMPMIGSAPASKTDGQQSTVPQQDDQNNVLNDLLAILQNAGIGGDQSKETPTPNAAGGNELDGSELQSGVDGPVNDKNSEPGSKDPRNDTISGQVFVPQLAMPRGMGMSVEGDVHTHEIDVKPQGPDEVQVTLAKDSDDAIVDAYKDYLARVQGGNTRDGEAKLIVPYGDYAQEVGDETARDHQDNAQVDATVGVQGDDVKKVANTGGGILPSNLEEADLSNTFEEEDDLANTFEDAAFGHATAAPGQEQTMKEEDMSGTFEDATFGHETPMEDSTFGHNTTQNQQAGQGNAQMKQKTNQAVAEDSSMDEEVKALVSRLNALLGKDQPEDDAADSIDSEQDDEDYYSLPKEDGEMDDDIHKDDDKVKEGFDFADATANEIEKHKNVKEGEQSCNECGMYESKCSCEITESRLFTNLLKMFEEAKPDFADIDDDGDEKETMKKAAKDKKKEKIDEWANSPQGESEDEEFITDMEFMTKVISGGLNKPKKDQTVLPKTSVVAKESEDDGEDETKQLKKLAGLK
jgi:hypothetical protein